MDIKIVVLLLILGIGLLFSHNFTKKMPTHHLMNPEKAEGYRIFQEWMVKNNVEFTQGEQKIYRFGKFFSNYLFVKEHNQRFFDGKQTFDLELNKFAHMDNFEFRSIFTGLHRQNTDSCKGQITIIDNPPQQVDWSSTAVSRVKDQGSCGSCWAFSVCGALEGLYAIQTGNITSFSPQQLVDCAGGSYKNQGCNGGDMANGFWYVIDNGIALNSVYPYLAMDRKCNYTADKKVFGISQCARVPANKTIALQSAVVKQPVSISVQADGLAFQFYKSGVYTKKCGTDLDHGILLTGYGSLKGVDYWKCKNSWGDDWGMNGYILLSRSASDGAGQCGVLMDNSVPIV